MEDYTWKTLYPHDDNNETMQDYLDNHCVFDITMHDGAYAEGINSKGEKYEMHAIGNGDFYSHKVMFYIIKTKK